MTRLILIMLIFPFARVGFTQELDTRETLDVIKKWNFASNAMSESTFREIYADRLVFYTKTLSEKECIAMKRSAFRADPAFKQKITSDPSFKPFTSGVVKADFVKEVLENRRWRKFHTYLLISYEKNQYLIVGESDAETDRKYNYKLSLGTPMDIPQARPIARTMDSIDTNSNADTDVNADIISTTDTTIVDSSFTQGADTSVAVASRTSEDSTILSSVTEEVLSDEIVAVPKKYVYFLIGFLVLAAVIVVVARKPGKTSRKVSRQPKVKETSLLRNDKSFENFLVTLFDPQYFTRKAFAREPAFAGNVARPDFIPSLEFEFQNKESRVRLAIESIYIPHLASRQILSYSSNQINRYHNFEEDSGMQAYLIIGLEGEAGDPKELFLIPTAELREGHLGYKDLQPFKKHGMFFYNSVRLRLL